VRTFFDKNGTKWLNFRLVYKDNDKL